MRLSQTVDEDMQALLGKTKASVTSAALLLTIDYLDRFQKANRSATNMRTQIKGYLTDAANAKLLFDEEKKRSDLYAREVGELTNRLEQIQAASSRGEDIKMLMEEHNVLLEERTSILSQLDYANNLLNTSIASREEEIAKLQNDIRGYIDQLELKNNQLAHYEQQLQLRQEEIERLLVEIGKLENVLNDQLKKAEQPAPAMQYNTGEFGKLVYENEYTQESLPLFQNEPVNELPYEYDDMPNLNWTENL
jgi:cell division protein ZapA